MTVEAVLPVPVLVGQTSHAVAAVSPLNVPASQSEQSSLPAALVGLNLPASQAVQLLTAPENAPPSHFLGWPVKMWPDAHVKLQMLPLFTLSVHDMVTPAGLVWWCKYSQIQQWRQNRMLCRRGSYKSTKRNAVSTTET